MNYGYVETITIIIDSTILLKPNLTIKVTFLFTLLLIYKRYVQEMVFCEIQISTLYLSLDVFFTSFSAISIIVINFLD